MKISDITNEVSIRQAVEKCVANFGGIDVLVCNAGAFPPSVKIEELSAEALQKSMDLNFQGHIAMLRLCTPFLKLGFDASVILVIMFLPILLNIIDYVNL